MGTLSKCVLLFALNWLDAQLTLVWIHMDVATEGNGLMARVLSHGELPFIGVKIVIGFFAAYILYRASHFPIARHGLSLVLAVYTGLMVIHAATGCVALGWNGPITFISFVGHLPQAILGFFS